jgi:hypothetical protein
LTICVRIVVLAHKIAHSSQYQQLHNLVAQSTVEWHIGADHTATCGRFRSAIDEGLAAT